MRLASNDVSGGPVIRVTCGRRMGGFRWRKNCGLVMEGFDWLTHAEREMLLGGNAKLIYAF